MINEKSIGFTAAVLLIILAGMSAAEPLFQTPLQAQVEDLIQSGQDEGVSRVLMSYIPAERGFRGGPEGDSAMISFRNFHGFALNENDLHILDIGIESIKLMEPVSMMELLATNKTLGEIRDEIRAAEGEVTHRGIMKLGDGFYQLVAINITPASGNNTTLEADVIEPRFGEATDTAPVIAGHLTVEMNETFSAEVSEGNLIITSGKLAGDYRVLLDMQDQGGPRMDGGGMNGMMNDMVQHCMGQPAPVGAGVPERSAAWSCT